MSVCFAAGFAAGTAACGMKPDGAPDLALVTSAAPAAAAAMFTRNAVAAAPVVVSREQAAGGGAQAVVVNSGLANACTGERGLADAWAMVDATAAAAGVERGRVLVASTGVIGRPLPIGRVLEGIDRAAAGLSADNGLAAAEAIRTTDAYAKVAQAELRLAGAAARVGGMAKGAGMIRPDMATTLAVITTDAGAAPAALAGLLRDAVDESFNTISVDGCTSTNDCVFLLANGAANAVAETPRALEALGAAVAEVALELARQVVADGEGATRVCTIEVAGAASVEDARRAARAVAENLLVKCALHGADPNWGRMLAALGASGAALRPDLIGVAVGGVQLVAGGVGLEGAEPAARSELAARAPHVLIDLNLGEGRARVMTSDLSPGYVEFNAGVTS